MISKQQNDLLLIYKLMSMEVFNATLRIPFPICFEFFEWLYTTFSEDEMLIILA